MGSNLQNGRIKFSAILSLTLVLNLWQQLLVSCLLQYNPAIFYTSFARLLGPPVSSHKVRFFLTFYKKLFDEPCIGDLLLSQKFLVFDSVFIEMSEAHNIFIMWNLDSMRMLSTKCEFSLFISVNCKLMLLNWV